MRTFVPRLVVLGSVGLASIIGTVAFLAARDSPIDAPINTGPSSDSHPIGAPTESAT